MSYVFLALVKRLSTLQMINARAVCSSARVARLLGRSGGTSEIFEKRKGRRRKKGKKKKKKNSKEEEKEEQEEE